MSIQKSKSSDKQNLNPVKGDKDSVIEFKSENNEIINFVKTPQAENLKLTDKIESLEKAQDIIFEQFRTLELQRTSLEKQQNKLEEESRKFRGRTIDLFGKMIDLKKAKKTISQHKEEIENHREELKVLNASKDKFFSIIAHDLRNPIAGFLNLTEILTNNFDVFSEKESKEFIEKNDGKIWVESEFNKGSTFIFTLKTA